MKEIDEWLKQTGMKEARLGLLACANSFAVERIRRKTATLETAESVISFVRSNPPENYQKDKGKL